MPYTIHQTPNRKFYRAWTQGVTWEEQAKKQVERLLRLDCVQNVVVMPDTHFGKGGPVGVGVKFVKAIVPSVIGVDIGCGMLAHKLNIQGDQLHHLPELRKEIQRVVPSGQRGCWDRIPDDIHEDWAGGSKSLQLGYVRCNERFDDFEPGWDPLRKTKAGKTARHKHPESQLGTLGSGNHFFEVSVDQDNTVWLVVHSGSRGAGAAMGGYFCQRAKELAEQWLIHLPDDDYDLAYLPLGTPEYYGYLEYMEWAQRYAKANRECMMRRVIDIALPSVLGMSPKTVSSFDIHHNFLEISTGIARKGAVKLADGWTSILPGAMGARTYIVRGKPGLCESMLTCAHGAGRVMGRKAAEQTISMEDHVKDLDGLECDKSRNTLDESARAYKPVDDVIVAQSDLIEPINILTAKVCVKGI